MQITRQSPFTGEWNSMELDVTKEQLHAWRWGTLIQDAMPNLTSDEREFIKIGVTPQEWALNIGEE
jgi:hypothetical protein|tara:strand:+ start:415 stop:612 length:198 start_codon:yes stop_codon:yes gene_type:complete